MNNFVENGWREIKHLKKNVHKWGNPDLIHHDLLLKLDLLREYMGRQILIICGNDTGYCAHKGELTSHQSGKAVDVICPEHNLFQFYLDAERMQFPQIGIYRDWYYQRRSNVIGGLHLSVDDSGHLRKNRWLSIQIGDREETLDLTHENLKKFYVI